MCVCVCVCVIDTVIKDCFGTKKHEENFVV